VKLRAILILLVIIIGLAATASYFYRVTESGVVVYKMMDFSEMQTDSKRVIKNKSAVKQFTYAVRFANKQLGEVDITSPPFGFTLGNKQYYLWVSEEYGQGTIMKLPNTGTIYTIDKSRARKLVDILNREYETQLNQD